MKRTIKYGDHTAVIFAGSYRASIVVDGPSLPTVLADAINKEGDITVHGVMMNDKGQNYITLTHNLPVSLLLTVICEVFSDVYHTDVTVVKPAC